MDQPSQQSWFYQAIQESGKANAKLVHQHQNRPSFQNTHTHPTQGNQSFLCYVIPQALTSLPVLFRGCGEESQLNSSICLVLNPLVLSSTLGPHSPLQCSPRTKPLHASSQQLLKLLQGKNTVHQSWQITAHGKPYPQHTILHAVAGEIYCHMPQFCKKKYYPI